MERSPHCVTLLVGCLLVLTSTATSYGDVNGSIDRSAPEQTKGESSVIADLNMNVNHENSDSKAPLSRQSELLSDVIPITSVLQDDDRDEEQGDCQVDKKSHRYFIKKSLPRYFIKKSLPQYFVKKAHSQYFIKRLPGIDKIDEKKVPYYFAKKPGNLDVDSKELSDYYFLKNFINSNEGEPTVSGKPQEGTLLKRLFGKMSSLDVDSYTALQRAADGYNNQLRRNEKNFYRVGK